MAGTSKPRVDRIVGVWRACSTWDRQLEDLGVLFFYIKLPALPTDPGVMAWTEAKSRTLLTKTSSIQMYNQGQRVFQFVGLCSDHEGI
jgi:hypothetical protein